MEVLVTCDTLEHLRALVCKLVRDEVPFRAYPRFLEVWVEVPKGKPLYHEEALAETANEKVHFDYDCEEAKGRLTVGPGSYGPAIAINGEDWFAVDFFHASPCWTREPKCDPLPAQVLLYNRSDDYWAKVTLEDSGRMVVIIDNGAAEVPHHPRAIHSVPSDHVFLAPWEPSGASEAPEVVEDPDRPS